MVTGVRGLLVVLFSCVVAVFAIIVCGGGSEGTVVAKVDQGVYNYACHAGGTVTSPVAFPVWGTCSSPECWQLIIVDRDGNTSEPCVSREEYDSARLGAFWHGRTDR